MPQLSLYLDDVAMEQLRLSAGAAGVSLSKYAAGVLAEAKEKCGYPADFFKLYGCLADVDIECPEDAAPAPVPALY